ncbi:zinc finger, CCHC-type containing protein [Tanacetum coccineum]
MDVVPRDDIAIDVESLATKYPIVDWKIHVLTENMMYYQIIRADGSSKNYKIFSEMLDDFDRQDVMDLHRLVQERYDTTSPEGHDLLLWGDLKILFEPNEEDEIWKNQQDCNLISWRLFDSCRIHILMTYTGIVIHMMIEKKYPLTQEMLSRMLSRRLKVDLESEIAFELLRMREIFRLLKELTTIRTPKKVLVRDETRHPVTKHINAISLVKIKEEKGTQDNAISDNDIVRPDGSDMVVSLKEVDKENEVGNRARDEVVKSAVGYYLKHKINEKLVKGLIESQRFNDSLSASRVGITDDVLVDVVGYVYHVDFVILDIKEDKKRPFILGTPILTTTKAVIKFDKGTITLRFEKSKMSFNRIPESLCRIEKGIKNDIEPIAPTMIVNRLILEWEVRIKLNQEKEMEFDQWRSKILKNKRPVLVKLEREVKDEEEVT